MKLITLSFIFVESLCNFTDFLHEIQQGHILRQFSGNLCKKNIEKDVIEKIEIMFL